MVLLCILLVSLQAEARLGFSHPDTVVIAKRQILKKEIKRHELISESTQTKFSLTEIPYFDHYDMADGLAFDSHNNAWIVSAKTSRAIMIDAKTFELKEYQLPENFGPRVVCVDKNDVLWVGSSLAQLILEFYPGQERAAVHNPGTLSWINYMVIDEKNDTLWYTVLGINLLGKFDKTRGFEIYNIPTFGSAPGGIGVDSHGRVWFTLVYGNGIASFDPVREQFKEYTLPTESAAPFALLIDAEDNIWVGEHDADKLAYFRDGEFQEFDLPHAKSGINSLSQAPDGTIWFSEGGWGGSNNGNRIGSLNPITGEIDEITLPHPNSQPQSLKVNSIGEIWFVEMGTGNIACLKRRPVN